MRGAYKYRLYPTRAQVAFLEELKSMRAEGLIGLANFSCCQDVLRRLDKTFQAFFARVQRGEHPGFPRFRSLRRYDSITFPSYGDGCRLLDHGQLRIQGAGLIKVKLHRPVEGSIQTVTIKRDISHWYVCLSVERQTVALPESSEHMGVDVGLDSFAVLSDGTEIDNPRQLKRGLAHLSRAQRRLARCKGSSHRCRKAAVLVAQAHRRIRNQRASFHHEFSRWLVNRYGWIAVEDLKIQRSCAQYAGTLGSGRGMELFLCQTLVQGCERRASAGEGRPAWIQPDLCVWSAPAQDPQGSLARMPRLRVVGAS